MKLYTWTYEKGLHDGITLPKKEFIDTVYTHGGIRVWNAEPETQVSTAVLHPRIHGLMVAEDDGTNISFLEFHLESIPKDLQTRLGFLFKIINLENDARAWRKSNGLGGGDVALQASHQTSFPFTTFSFLLPPTGLVGSCFKDMFGRKPKYELYLNGGEAWKEIMAKFTEDLGKL